MLIAFARNPHGSEEALIRFLLETGFRIGENAVAEWLDVDWEDKTISVRFKPKFGSRPKDYEERYIVVNLIATLTQTPGVWGYSSHFGLPRTQAKGSPRAISAKGTPPARRSPR